MPNWTSNEVRFKSRINSKKQLEIEGYDESCDEIISSNTEIEENV